MYAPFISVTELVKLWIFVTNDRSSGGWSLYSTSAKWTLKAEREILSEMVEMCVWACLMYEPIDCVQSMTKARSTFWWSWRGLHSDHTCSSNEDGVVIFNQFLVRVHVGWRFSTGVERLSLRCNSGFTQECWWILNRIFQEACKITRNNIHLKVTCNAKFRVLFSLP